TRVLERPPTGHRVGPTARPTPSLQRVLREQHFACRCTIRIRPSTTRSPARSHADELAKSPTDVVHSRSTSIPRSKREHRCTKQPPTPQTECQTPPACGSAENPSDKPLQAPRSFA